jgi:DNA-binding response OmpR family regulator
MARILVVEDQPALLLSMQKGLREEGHEVLTAICGSEAYLIAKREPIDAMVLDLMLPDGSGLDTLRSLRREGFVKPVLIVTARDALEDRVIGLDSGADDYLVKPFGFVELVARLRALLRRNFSSHETVLRCDNLELDLLSRTVKRGGEVIELTRRQFDLLEYLMRNMNQTVTREMLARDVWKAATATWTNVIEVQMRQLRMRLERPDWTQIIHTVRGEGYQLGTSP